MTLFKEDGHLTDLGLRSVIEGGLDELQSLEASEHLAFCDACLLRYTALLDNTPLLAPETPLKDPVMRRIRRRGARMVLTRYGTVAAAAVLAVTMWMVGTLVLPGVGRLQEEPAPQAQTAPAAQPDTTGEDGGFGSRIGAAVGNIWQGITSFFVGEPGQPTVPEPAAQQPDDAPPQPTAPEPAPAPKPSTSQQPVQQQTRRQRDALFGQLKPGGIDDDNAKAA
ncbi:MAG: hypothetical protein GXY32_01835 [Ruminococcaceae bacterium]|nr:hypothetical protein [Oscillospiraceae bacterium]